MKQYKPDYRNFRDFIYTRRIRKVETRRYDLINMLLADKDSTIRIGPIPKENRFSGVFKRKENPLTSDLSLDVARASYFQGKCLEET